MSCALHYNTLHDHHAGILWRRGGTSEHLCQGQVRIQRLCFATAVEEPMPKRFEPSDTMHTHGRVQEMSMACWREQSIGLALGTVQHQCSQRVLKLGGKMNYVVFLQFVLGSIIGHSSHEHNLERVCQVLGDKKWCLDVLVDEGCKATEARVSLGVLHAIYGASNRSRC